MDQKAMDNTKIKRLVIANRILIIYVIISIIVMIYNSFLK